MMQLILLTPEHSHHNEPEVVNSLFEHGLNRLHLRKPAFSADEYRAYLNKIDDRFHGNIVLCGHFELYNEFGLGGVHLNSKFRKDEVVRESIKNIPLEFVSASFHSWDGIINNTMPYGYVFISPVFDSISKKGHTASVDLGRVNRARHICLQQNNYCPLIFGLGGVGVEQARTLHTKGFDGAVILGSVWENKDHVGKFVEINNAVSSLSID